MREENMQARCVCERIFEITSEKLVAKGCSESVICLVFKSINTFKRIYSQNADAEASLLTIVFTSCFRVIVECFTFLIGKIFEG